MNFFDQGYTILISPGVNYWKCWDNSIAIKKSNKKGNFVEQFDEYFIP